MPGWGLILAGVTAYDIYAFRHGCDTLSEAARKRKPLAALGVAAFVYHIFLEGK